LEYGSVEDLLPEGIPQGLFPDSAAMMIRRESCCSDEIRSFVSLKFPEPGPSAWKRETFTFSPSLWPKP
jgi:hypothetical protein